MSQASRFEATLNLACAAMTVLFCGELTGEQRAALRDSVEEIEPLREEFAPFFSRHAHYTNRFAELVCPDLGAAPYYYSEYAQSRRRLRVLLNLRSMPSTVLRAVSAESGMSVKWPRRTLSRRNAEKVCARTGIDSQFASYCWHTRIDLDPLWHALRRELRKACEMEGLL